MIDAKPTIYKDIRFRSRLEARWACFFDQLEWTWEYEPMDLNGWTPDFLLSGAKPVLVEVKPLPRISEGMTLPQEARKILRAPKQYDVLLTGLSPFVADDGYGAAAIGLLWCREFDHWGRGLISECGDIFSEFGSWTFRRSGEYRGDSHITHMEKREAERRWAVGVNMTQREAARERTAAGDAWRQRAKWAGR